jgi:phosphoenolpyruvate-protein phosphotransferase
MINKIKYKAESEHLKISKKHKIDINLIEILTGDRKGTYSENKLLNKLKNKLGYKFYIELIYFLTHTLVKSGLQAKRIFNEIIKHRVNLNRKLNRNVGIQVAILDYSRNINRTLKDPTIIEESKITEMAQHAVTDKMTKAYDKAFLFHDLDKEIQKTKRYGTKFSLLMIDLDNLKTINDKFGHTIGDKALMLLCEIVIKNIRKSDTLYRFGGDEFLVLIPMSTEIYVAEVAQRILKTVRNTSKRKCGVKFSVSIGMAAFNKNNIKNISGVIKVVDKALHYAKNTGRNKLSSLQKDPFLKIEKEAKKKLEVVAVINKDLIKSRFEINGLIIFSGIAIGKAFVYEDIITRQINYKELSKEEVVEELKRIENAIKEVEEDIIKMRDRVTDILDKKYGDIFDVHRILLKDPQILIDLETELINERISAENAVKIVFTRIENRFKTTENIIIQEKSDDILDLQRRLLHSLRGIGKNVLSDIPPNSIIVASRLLPSDTVNLKQFNVNAIITEKGSKTSHSGLLAKSFNIPYIAGIDCPKERIKTGMNIIVDSDTGKVIVNPSPDEISKCRITIQKDRAKQVFVYDKVRNMKLIKGRKKINILANVNSRDDIKKAIEFNCDGIGLYRIEQIYIKRTLPPSEDELFNELNESFKDVPKEITVRLLDIGGDKTLPYIRETNELNSFLGLRGIRILLKNPKIIETQLKAFLRLRQNYKLKVLIPMVSIPEEVIKVKEVLKRIVGQFRNKGLEYRMELGSMIETPSAVIKIKEILKESDFVSIGSNDLIQYTMASGREDESVADYYETGSEIIMESIKTIIREANKEKKECILCGELASDTKYLKSLLKIGLENFSVYAASIPQIKNSIAKILSS